jgi:hypothetical protein
VRSSDLPTLIEKYALKGVCPDTNIVLIAVIGLYDQRRIESFKRTQSKGYGVEDYRLIMRLLRRFSKRLTTPNILTEVDNLGRQLPENEHRGFSKAFTWFVDNYFEVHEPSIQTVRSLNYTSLGLTDAGLISLSAGALILTDDFRLAGKITGLMRDAINIHHLRGFSA